MPFDLAAHLGAMSRTVENLERDGKPAKAVIAARTFETDAADLWDALTNQQRLPRWFARIDGDLRLGGRFHVENNASGTITACEPNRHIAGTWEFAGGMSWIEIRLSPEGSGTRLELTHIAPVDPHWDKFGPGAVGVGWDLGFMGLARHLAEPQAEVAMEAVQGWFGSDEARQMIRSASDGWGSAAIKAGENDDHALAAAEATRQFFTGEAPPPEM
ncbi:SRPBCC family protein [Devosia sp. ZB163]|uniref:SRPBCC family protein n=1 Tax=Devosia sp. ZB163 TaxID=3025938 RepID=UPI0023612A7B|nr:SRPBCC family protein [Devosia sp. ZB163]MDC9822408.1 SRPBCC family protein [Devosia sp. ZB163]